MDTPASTPTTMEPIRLTDVVRAVGGWPIDLDRVADVFAAADALLPEGRECHRPLTPGEVAALELVA